MKWLVIAGALLWTEGCCLNGGAGSASSTGSPTNGGVTSGPGTSVGTTTGAPFGGTTSSAAASTSSTGAGSTGTSTGTTGGTTGGATSTGGKPPPCGCDAGLETICCPGASGESCVNTLVDPSNCGICGNVCPGPLDQCANGTCVCPNDGMQCPASDGGSFCADIVLDPDNCGGCGNVCVAPASECQRESCMCPADQTLCGSSDGGSPAYCINTTQNAQNCGGCGYDCDTEYAAESGCRFGFCSCEPGTFCAVSSSGQASCACVRSGGCVTLSFATDVYPLLAQQDGTFGCSASGCHSGAGPAGALAFLDSDGDQDAGMAYAELVGDQDGGGSGGGSACDAGTPAGVPSTQCACVSRVIPGNASASYLADVLTDNLPCPSEAMPITDAGAWAELGACGQQLIEQWVNTGANP